MRALTKFVKCSNNSNFAGSHVIHIKSDEYLSASKILLHVTDSNLSIDFDEHIDSKINMPKTKSLGESISHFFYLIQFKELNKKFNFLRNKHKICFLCGQEWISFRRDIRIIWFGVS